MWRSALRTAALVALGIVLGLAWNAFGGRGLVLGANAYLHEGDEEIAPAEARRRLDRGALFLDARPREFHEFRRIPGALSLPEDDFERAFAALEPQLRSRFDIVVYCSGFGCEASHLVARKLEQRGIPAVVMSEGMPGWEDAGYPLEEGKGK